MYRPTSTGPGAEFRLAVVLLALALPVAAALQGHVASLPPNEVAVATETTAPEEAPGEPGGRPSRVEARDATDTAAAAERVVAPTGLRAAPRL